MKDREYEFLLNSYDKHNVTRENICNFYFGCEPQNIKETVVIAPWWEPDIFPEFIPELIHSAMFKHWQVSLNEKKFSYIKTGIGASVCADAVLVLGCTDCKNIIFI